MLTQKQITEVEAIFIARDYNCISDDIFVNSIEHFYKINLYQFMYLKWLITRWTIIRKQRYQMPTRILYISLEQSYLT